MSFFGRELLTSDDSVASWENCFADERGLNMRPYEIDKRGLKKLRRRPPCAKNQEIKKSNRPLPESVFLFLACKRLSFSSDGAVLYTCGTPRGTAQRARSAGETLEWWTDQSVL